MCCPLQGYRGPSGDRGQQGPPGPKVGQFMCDNLINNAACVSSQ